MRLKQDAEEAGKTPVGRDPSRGISVSVIPSKNRFSLSVVTTGPSHMCDTHRHARTSEHPYTSQPEVMSTNTFVGTLITFLFLIISIMLMNQLEVPQ